MVVNLMIFDQISTINSLIGTHDPIFTKIGHYVYDHNILAEFDNQLFVYSCNNYFEVCLLR